MRDEPHRAGRRVQRAGDSVPIDMNSLAGNMRGVTILTRIVQPDHAARLHRVGDNAVIVQPQPHHMGGRAERGIHGGGVSRAPVHAQIAGHLLRHFRRAVGPGRIRIGYRRQGSVADLDQLGGVQRLGLRLRDDQHHRLPGETHLSGGQQRLRQKGERLPGLRIGLHAGAHRLQPVRLRVRAGQHRQHPRRRPRGVGIDPPDPCMGVRGAQQHGMSQAVETEIIQIPALANQEAGILSPPGGVTDGGKFRHCLCLPGFLIARLTVCRQMTMRRPGRGVFRSEPAPCAARRGHFSPRAGASAFPPREPCLAQPCARLPGGPISAEPAQWRSTGPPHPPEPPPARTDAPHSRRWRRYTSSAPPRPCRAETLP